MSGSLLLVVFIILVALAFDYINGFHDAANSIATVVSTRVLTPMQAVAWAAFFNFVAAFGFGVQVARTVGKGVVDAGLVDQWVILGGLAGAITWNCCRNPHTTESFPVSLRSTSRRVPADPVASRELNRRQSARG